MIQACIFDLDGVIVDTAYYHYLSWKRLAHEAFGFELKLEHNERLKGVSRQRSLEIILELADKQLTTEEQMVLAEKKNTWFNEYIDKMSPDEIFPGVNELIQSLKNEGLKVALASSSKNARKAVRQLQVEPLFDAIVDGTMITHSKPHPEIFLQASSMIEIDSPDCLVFEDAEAGVEAAVNAGMKCVGIGSPETLAKADIILPRTGDFSIAMLDAFGKNE